MGLSPLLRAGGGQRVIPARDLAVGEESQAEAKNEGHNTGDGLKVCEHVDGECAEKETSSQSMIAERSGTSSSVPETYYLRLQASIHSLVVRFTPASSLRRLSKSGM